MKEAQEAALLPYRIHIIHTQMAPFNRKTRSKKRKKNKSNPRYAPQSIQFKPQTVQSVPYFAPLKSACVLAKATKEQMQIHAHGI